MNYKVLYLKDNSYKIFDYNDSIKPNCLSTVFCKNEKEFVKNIRKNKCLYLLNYNKINEIITDSTEQIFIFTVNNVTKKSYKNKIKLLIYQDDYEVYFKKNNEMNLWEIEKIIYPPRLESIRKKTR